MTDEKQKYNIFVIIECMQISKSDNDTSYNFFIQHEILKRKNDKIKLISKKKECMKSFTEKKKSMKFSIKKKKYINSNIKRKKKQSVIKIKKAENLIQKISAIL